MGRVVCSNLLNGHRLSRLRCRIRDGRRRRPDAELRPVFPQQIGLGEAVGLADARAESRAALLKLARLSEKIAKAKPLTTDGALAMLQYAEIRIEGPNLYDDGDNIARIIKRARSFLISRNRNRAAA